MKIEVGNGAKPESTDLGNSHGNGNPAFIAVVMETINTPKTTTTPSNC